MKCESPHVTVAPDGTVQSDEGWAVRLLGPDLVEYCEGRTACLVNVVYVAAEQQRHVCASESASELFPHLIEDLQSAVRLLNGRYIVV